MGATAQDPLVSVTGPFTHSRVHPTHRLQVTATTVAKTGATLPSPGRTTGTRSRSHTWQPLGTLGSS